MRTTYAQPGVPRGGHPGSGGDRFNPEILYRERFRTSDPYRVKATGARFHGVTDRYG
jgi:hypothetical protein